MQKNQLQRRHRQLCLKIDPVFRGLMSFERSFYRFWRQQETMCRRHFWYSRYHVPPLQCCGIAECLRSFLSAFECPIIPAVQRLLTYSNSAKVGHNLPMPMNHHSSAVCYFPLVLCPHPFSYWRSTRNHRLPARIRGNTHLQSWSCPWT